MRSLIPLMLCAACVTPPAGAREPTEQEAAIVATVAHDCDQETIDAVLVLTPTTHADMYRATGYGGPGCDPATHRFGCAAGAFRGYRSGAWPLVLAEPWSPLIVMWHASASDALLAHEASHLAERCRGEPHDHGAEQ